MKKLIAEQSSHPARVSLGPAQKAKPSVAISARDAKTLARLLRTLKTHLTCAIETCLVPGETEPVEAWEKFDVARDRRDIQNAERFIRMFGGKRR